MVAGDRLTYALAFAASCDHTPFCEPSNKTRTVRRSASATTAYTGWLVRVPTEWFKTCMAEVTGDQCREQARIRGPTRGGFPTGKKCTSPSVSVKPHEVHLIHMGPSRGEFGHRDGTPSPSWSGWEKSVAPTISQSRHQAGRPQSNRQVGMPDTHSEAARGQARYSTPAGCTPGPGGHLWLVVGLPGPPRAC